MASTDYDGDVVRQTDDVSAPSSSSSGNPLRRNVSSGAPWESIVGYSRAVRVGNHISVAGTTATDENGKVVAQGNAYEQARYALKKVEDALREVDAKPSDVVRTRMFVINIDKNWQEIGRAHGEVFGTIRPAATMVEVSRLIDPEHLVEIEVDAFVDKSSSTS
jgi:enamine deaminase RidA (YjgF/YER057c/UK114 family)